MDAGVLLILFFLAVAGLLAAGGVMAWRAFLERRAQSLKDAPQHRLLTGVVVLGDVQSRTLDQFIAVGLKGTQTRSAIHEGRVPLLLTYTIKRVANGAEHTLWVSLGGPPIKDDAVAKRALAEQAQFAVYLAMMTRLVPPTPVDLDVARRSLGLTRTVTEEDTRAMQTRRLRAPPMEEAEGLHARAEAEAAEVRRQLGVEG